MYPNKLNTQRINTACNTYLLVNLVDNDYQKENCIWSLLKEVVEMKSDYLC